MPRIPEFAHDRMVLIPSKTSTSWSAGTADGEPALPSVACPTGYRPSSSVT